MLYTYMKLVKLKKSKSYSQKNPDFTKFLKKHPETQALLKNPDLGGKTQQWEHWSAPWEIRAWSQA